MEQTWAAAAGHHLADMVDRLTKRTGLGAVARHGGEQPVEAAAHHLGRLAGGIVQDPGRLVGAPIRRSKRLIQSRREPASADAGGA